MFPVPVSLWYRPEARTTKQDLRFNPGFFGVVTAVHFLAGYIAMVTYAARLTCSGDQNLSTAQIPDSFIQSVYDKATNNKEQ